MHGAALNHAQEDGAPAARVLDAITAAARAVEEAFARGDSRMRAAALLRLGEATAAAEILGAQQISTGAVYTRGWDDCAASRAVRRTRLRAVPSPKDAAP